MTRIQLDGWVSLSGLFKEQAGKNWQGRRSKAGKKTGLKDVAAKTENSVVRSKSKSKKRRIEST